MKTTAAILALCAATACSASIGDHTTGVDHNLTFTYISGPCLFGCDLSDPLMVGTQETLMIKGTLPAVSSVASSDPSVVAASNASLSCCSTGSSSSGTSTTCTTAPPQSGCPSGTTASLLVDVAALQTGSARVQVLDGGGKEVDAVILDVEQAASLTLACGTGTIAVSASCAPTWTARDAQGAELRAARGVMLSTSDVNVVALRTGLGPTGPTVAGDQGLLGSVAIGVSAGDAVITGTVANVSATTTVHVTP